MEKLYDIKLNLQELLQMDGKVSEQAQLVINRAKKENSYGFELPVMNEILRRSEEVGILSWKYKQIKSCSYCDKKPDYHRYTRSSRYHSKGDKNYDNPKYYSGIAFNEGFVAIAGYGDMCTECCKKHDVIKRLVTYIIDNDLKVEIKSREYVGKYIKDPIQKCYNCSNEMTESSMTKGPTVMGDGYCPSGCPKCGAKSHAFGKSHGTTKEFSFIINPEYDENIFKVKDIMKRHNSSVLDSDDHFEFFRHKGIPSRFGVREARFTNRDPDVITFDTVARWYKAGYFWVEKCPFEHIFENAGYENKTENSFPKAGNK